MIDSNCTDWADTESAERASNNEEWRMRQASFEKRLHLLEARLDLAVDILTGLLDRSVRYRVTKMLTGDGD